MKTTAKTNSKGDKADTLSETVSEKIEPRKRGRPEVVDPRLLATMQALWPDITTKRGLQNNDYTCQAMVVLKGTEGIEWLYDYQQLDRTDSRKGNFRRAILAELGRETDPDLMKTMALKLCELKPTSQDARAMVRRWRRQKSCPSSPEGLANELCRVINSYRQRHPELTGQQIREALAMLKIPDDM